MKKERKRREEKKGDKNEERTNKIGTHKMENSSRLLFDATEFTAGVESNLFKNDGNSYTKETNHVFSSAIQRLLRSKIPLHHDYPLMRAKILPKRPMHRP